MPTIGAITGGIDFSNYFAPLSSNVSAAVLAQAREQGAVLAYGNFITVVVNFLIVAFVLDLVKKGDANGWESTHFSYRIRTVLWAALLYLMTSPLWFLFVFPGWLAWVAISIWFLYRIVLGMVRLNGQRPVTNE